MIDQAFFRTNISKDLLAQLESLYMIKSDKMSVVISEVHHQLGKLGEGVDRLRLSNQCREILLENDGDFSPLDLQRQPS